MTNPPHGGSAPSTDFGATTLSGRSATSRGGAPSGTTTESEPSTDLPAETPPSTDAPTPGTTGGPSGSSLGSNGAGKVQAAPAQPSAGLGTIPAPPAVPGQPRTGERPDVGATTTVGNSAIRGIRTGRNRGPRRARLQIRHINPVTVLKFSCVLSIALFFVWLIVIGVLFGVLDAAGVIGHINDVVTQLNGSGSKAPVTAGIVFGGAAIIGVINIVLFIALSTIGAVIYNLCADLVGGVEITLSER